LIAGTSAWFVAVAPDSLLVRNGVLKGALKRDDPWGGMDAIAAELARRGNALVTVEAGGNSKSREQIIWGIHRVRYSMYPYRLLTGMEDEVPFDKAFAPSPAWLKENAIESVLIAHGDDAGNVRWRVLPRDASVR
jgi:hypothetical protein